MANVSQVKAQFATDITATATATIAALQTLGGAGNMTLTGAAATFGGTGSSQKVSLTSGGNISAVTFTITGTDSKGCLLYTSPSPRDGLLSRMPSSA